MSLGVFLCVKLKLNYLDSISESDDSISSSIILLAARFFDADAVAAAAFVAIFHKFIN